MNYDGTHIVCLSGTLKVQPLSRFFPLGHLGLAVVIVSSKKQYLIQLNYAAVLTNKI